MDMLKRKQVAYPQWLVLITDITNNIFKELSRWLAVVVAMNWQLRRAHVQLVDQSARPGPDSFS